MEINLIYLFTHVREPHRRQVGRIADDDVGVQGIARGGQGQLPAPERPRPERHRVRHVGGQVAGRLGVHPHRVVRRRPVEDHAGVAAVPEPVTLRVGLVARRTAPRFRGRPRRRRGPPPRRSVPSLSRESRPRMRHACTKGPRIAGAMAHGGRGPDRGAPGSRSGDARVTGRQRILREGSQAFPEGVAAEQGHEAAAARRVRGQARRPGDADDQLLEGEVADRNGDPAAGRELLGERGRNRGRSRGHEDGVERRGAGPAEGAVADLELDVVEAQRAGAGSGRGRRTPESARW